MIKYSTQSLDTWGEWFLFAALQSSLSMTMCLPLSDFVLTSGGDRQHISSNFFCARSHQHTQPWTHEMTKQPVNKEILSTKTSSFYLFTSSSTQTVSVLVVLQKYPPLCSKKAHRCLYFYFMNSRAARFRNSPLSILLISEVRPLHQRAPGSCGEPPHTSASIDSKHYWICTK